MGKKLLTEAQAWKEVARRFAEESERPKRTMYGLCDTTSELYWGEDDNGVDSDPLIDGATEEDMLRRITSYLGGETWAYGRGSSTKFCAGAREDNGRCLAALWMMMDAKNGVEARFEEKEDDDEFGGFAPNRTIYDEDYF